MAPCPLGVGEEEGESEEQAPGGAPPENARTGEGQATIARNKNMLAATNVFIVAINET